MDQTCRQFLRALRGKRSQLAFSRRLGFQSNVAARWEGGSRLPTALKILQASSRLGLRLDELAHAFHEASSHHLRDLGEGSIGVWLSALKGETQITDIANQTGLSRYQVSRCFSGETEAKLDVFFLLLDNLTGRLPEFVSLFVDIEQVHSLRSRYRAQRLARECAYLYPYSSAILALIDTYDIRLPGSRRGSVEQRVFSALPLSDMARRLDIDERVVEESARALLSAGIIGVCRGRLEVTGPLTIDTRSDPDRALALREHWARFSLARMKKRAPYDSFSHNVFSISRKDLLAFRELQADFFAKARSLIARSSPSEEAALFVMHLVTLDERSGHPGLLSTGSLQSGSATSAI